MAIHIQLRRDTSVAWVLQNPILEDGEVGLETDLRRFKIGDGLLPWNQLRYGGLNQDWFTANQETSSVVSGITTSILTHTFSAIKASKIYSITASGDNVSMYELFIDSVLVEKKRASFASSMNVEFNFNFGFKVGLGSTVQLKVVHMRSSNSDYNATLKYAEVL